jgi:hypothetical protein
MIYGMNRMVRIEQLAEAALTGDALTLRSLTQDWLAENRRIADCLPPLSSDPTILSVAAGLAELFADRRLELPPHWAAKIEPVHPPLYLVKAAKTMPRLRRLCETESPSALKRRNLLAPPTFLEFA